MLSARDLYLIAPQRAVKIPKAFIFIFFFYCKYIFVLSHSGAGAQSAAFLGYGGLKPSLLLNQHSCVLVKGPDWWFFFWSYCCMINILCIFIIIQNVNISRPTEDALVTVPAHQ